MRNVESAESKDGRLPARLAARLDPELQGALDNPVRRDVLRTLGHGGRSRSVAEIGAELRGIRLSQVAYHLQVLQDVGAVASDLAVLSSPGGRDRYFSELREDVHVRAVLRATERWDRQHREAAVAAASSPLLTMFRVPRPVRTIRLRGGRRADVERES